MFDFVQTIIMIYFNGISGKKYFEGWFFRIYEKDFNCALIPSVSVCDGEKRAYIQFNCGGISNILEFSIDEFNANGNCINIGGNVFSDNGIIFSCEQLSLNVSFKPFTIVEKDIMGCFKFGTPCKHKLISMKHFASGQANFNGKEYVFDKALCYIEKDWGKSFPKSYCWLQCNDFDIADVSFFLSIADIGLPFNGLICVLLVNGKEYRFATYNFALIKELQKGKIVLKRFDLVLEITFEKGSEKPLFAPECGKMKNIIKEDLNGKVMLRLSQANEIIFQAHGKNAGIEWVNYDAKI